jgi:hypothetical protein
VSSAKHAGNHVKLTSHNNNSNYPTTIVATGTLFNVASSLSPPLPSPNYRHEQELQDYISCAEGIQQYNSYLHTISSPEQQQSQDLSASSAYKLTASVVETPLVDSARENPFLTSVSDANFVIKSSERRINLTRHFIGRGHQAHFAASDTTSDEEITQIFLDTAEQNSIRKQALSSRTHSKNSRRKHKLTPEAAIFVGDSISYTDNNSHLLTSNSAIPLVFSASRENLSITDSAALVVHDIPVNQHRRRRVRTQDYVDSEDSEAEAVGHHRRDGYLNSSSHEYSDGYSDEYDSYKYGNERYYSSDEESVFSFTSRASTFNADEGAIVFPAPYQFRCDCYQRELADRYSNAYNSSSDIDSLDDEGELYSLQDFGGIQNNSLILYHNIHEHSTQTNMNSGGPIDGTTASLEAGRTRRRSTHTSDSIYQTKRRTLQRRLRPWIRRARHIVKHTEWFRTVASACYLFFVSLAMTLLQQVSDTRWLEHRPNQQVLYDTGFVLFNDISEHWLPDFFVLSLLGMTVIGVLWFCPTWPARQIVIRRLFWLTGSLYLYRAMTISVTTLPPPRPCNPVLVTGIPVLEVLKNGIKMLTGGAISCTDNIFSGHTMILVSCALHWRIYVRRKYIAYYVYLHVIAGIYTIIGTHMHYTVDIILAIFITYGMYAIYFCVIRLAMERHRWAVEEHRATGGKLWEKDDQEYQRVAYTPRMLNSGMIRVIVWMDGLDLRWRPDGSIDDGFGHIASNGNNNNRRRSTRRSRVNTLTSQPADIVNTATTVDLINNNNNNNGNRIQNESAAFTSVHNPPAGIGYVPNTTALSENNANTTIRKSIDESRLTGQRHIYPDTHFIDPVLGTNLNEPNEHDPLHNGNDSDTGDDELTHGKPSNTTTTNGEMTQL